MDNRPDLEELKNRLEACEDLVLSYSLKYPILHRPTAMQLLIDQYGRQATTLQEEISKWSTSSSSSPCSEPLSAMPRSGNHVNQSSRARYNARPRGPSYWRLYMYDVRGNKKDGWEVNDVSGAGIVECPLIQPSDSWVANLFGLRNHQVDIDGDDNYIIVDRRATGKPLFHLERINGRDTTETNEG